MDKTLANLSATEQARLFGSRELSPVEATQQIISLIEEANPSLNAFCTIDFDAALKAAKASERRYLAKEPLSPLDGVSIGVKDNIFVRGMRATWGSRLYESFIPDKDDIAIERLRNAGAIIIGKTNTPELALAGFTDNQLFGRTMNARGTHLSAGGSSGGSAAAVASGMTAISIGTDAGGSIRLPASLQGIFGFKPTTGRIPRRWGFLPLALDFQVVAPMARTLKDIEAATRIMAGASALDRASQYVFDKPDGKKAKRIATFSTIGSNPVDAACKEAVKAACIALESEGHRVEEVPCPFDLEVLRHFWGVLSASGVARVVEGFDGWREAVTPAILQQAERGLSLTARDYALALDALTDFRNGLLAFWQTYDAIICPTCAAEPWEWDRPFPEYVGGVKADVRANAIFTTFVNAIGHPAISVPYSSVKENRPIGVQVIGDYCCDETVIELAGTVAKTATWNTSPF